MQKVVPLKQNETANTYEKKLIYLDTKIEQTPTLAVFNAHLEICRMGKIAHENFSLALESFFESSENKSNKVIENEKTVDFLNQNITSKLVEINNMHLSSSEADRVARMFKVLSDIERIGDHAENIAEYTLMIKEDNLNLSDFAIEELKKLSDIATEIIAAALNAYQNNDKALWSQIELLEEEIDKLSTEFTNNHVERLKAESCEPRNGIIFTDMIIDLERSADHAKSIAFSILPENKKR